MNRLQEIIDHSKRIVFFGGAGVSTASGIPDFRSDGGLFAQEFGDGLTPEMMLCESFFYLHPARFFDFYRKYMLHPDARPNAAHRKLFELEKAGKLLHAKGQRYSRLMTCEEHGKLMLSVRIIRNLNETIRGKCTIVEATEERIATYEAKLKAAEVVKTAKRRHRRSNRSKVPAGKE